MDEEDVAVAPAEADGGEAALGRRGLVDEDGRAVQVPYDVVLARALERHHTEVGLRPRELRSERAISNRQQSIERVVVVGCVCVCVWGRGGTDQRTPSLLSA